MGLRKKRKKRLLLKRKYTFILMSIFNLHNFDLFQQVIHHKCFIFFLLIKEKYEHRRNLQNENSVL